MIFLRDFRLLIKQIKKNIVLWSQQTLGTVIITLTNCNILRKISSWPTYPLFNYKCDCHNWKLHGSKSSELQLRRKRVMKKKSLWKSSAWVVMQYFCTWNNSSPTDKRIWGVVGKINLIYKHLSFYSKKDFIK